MLDNGFIPVIMLIAINKEERKMNSDQLEKLCQGNNKKEIMEVLDPIIEYYSQALVAGVLKKRVLSMIESRGIKGSAANMILDMCIMRAKGFMSEPVK